MNQNFFAGSTGEDANIPHRINMDRPYFISEPPGDYATVVYFDEVNEDTLDYLAYRHPNQKMRATARAEFARRNR